MKVWAISAIAVNADQAAIVKVELKCNCDIRLTVISFSYGFFLKARMS